MRITEAHLRRIVRGALITEGVKGKIDSLINALIEINEESEDGGKTVVEIRNYSESAVFLFNRVGGQDSGRGPKGSVEIVKASSQGYGECSGAWVVVGSEVSSGWGPLLYDVAIEWATQNGGGLTSDRQEVSDDALNVWTRYMKQRGDVQKVQLDLGDQDMRQYSRARDKFNLKRITPRNKADDCAQESSFMHQSGGWEDDEVPDWYNSPLSRVYRKAPVVIGRLEDLGLLNIV
jgi:hypothetical protein